ncbi:MAG: glycosyltransferase [Actinomycetota bacterium]
MADVSRLRSWLRGYYHSDLRDLIAEQVPAGACVLDLGCGEGDLLSGLSPRWGVGVDIDDATIHRASRRHPELSLMVADMERLPLKGTFDFIIASNTVGFLRDVQAFFESLRRNVDPSTRIIVTYYNFIWEPVLKLAQRLKLKRPEPVLNWLSRADLTNLVELAGFETVASGYRSPVPVGPLPIARPLNRALGLVPLVNRVGITSYVVARPAGLHVPAAEEEPSVSVVIPTLNERGNVKDALERMPRLAARQEIIFVDGNSTDGTGEEIQAQMSAHEDLDIKLIHQGASAGKGDAVRKAFAAAHGEILMILDADLTVPPEDLPKFYRAMVKGEGEFVNGSRLVYPMEKQAMRFANILGNKFFSIVFSWIIRQRITDTLCGTKTLWATDYQRIAANRAAFGDSDPFGDFDLLFGAAKLGLQIREVPIRYQPRTYGETSISRWRNGLHLLKMALIGAWKLRLTRAARSPSN